MSGKDASIDVLQITREMACAGCGKAPPSDPDHIKTRGSGGSDELSNLMPLCRSCHTLRHFEGLNGLAKKRPNVLKILAEKGWEYDEVFKKWIRI
jgi:5-methylcytosine-specific restriction endonuclease McrA